MLKFIWNHKGPKIAEVTQSKKNNAVWIATPDFKVYYKATLINIAWYYHKCRHVDQWNKIEDPNTRTHNYSHLTADRGQKYKQEKRQHFH